MAVNLEAQNSQLRQPLGIDLALIDANGEAGAGVKNIFYSLLFVCLPVMGGIDWTELKGALESQDHPKMKRILRSDAPENATADSFARYKEYFSIIKLAITLHDTKAVLLVLHSAFNDKEVAGYFSGATQVPAESTYFEPLWLYGYCQHLDETSALLSYGVSFHSDRDIRFSLIFVHDTNNESSAITKLTMYDWDYTSPPARPHTVEELRSEILNNVNLLAVMAKARIIEEASDIWKTPLPPGLKRELVAAKIKCGL